MEKSIEKSTDSVPEHIRRIAEQTINDLVPTKSASRYWKEYNYFIEWCDKNSVKDYSEKVLLAYFSEKSKSLKASSLWTYYSMLRSTLLIKHKVSLEKYTSLIAFLKKTKRSYVAKKSSTLDLEQVESFIKDAPDADFLMIKVAMIIGTCAACRSDELKNMSIGDVEEKNDVIIIKIPTTKTGRPRTSCVTKKDWITLVKAYIAKRPINCISKRFFLYYAKNKCENRPVGIHTFGKMPCKIAEYLKLGSPEKFTGHCFRRSSATIWSTSGVSQVIQENVEFNLKQDNLPNLRFNNCTFNTVNFNFK